MKISLECIYNVLIIILLVSLTIVHPVVQLIHIPCMQAFCVCIVLDSHAQLTVNAKCIFCLRKDVYTFLLFKTTFILKYIHAHKLQWEDFHKKMLTPCSPFNCNMQLPHAKRIKPSFQALPLHCTGRVLHLELGFRIPVTSVWDCSFRKLQLAHTSDLKWAS